MILSVCPYVQLAMDIPTSIKRKLTGQCNEFEVCVRFLFFFPPPAATLPEPLSGDAACPDTLFGDVPLWETLGAGVAEERPAVALAGVSGTVESDGAVGIVND